MEERQSPNRKNSITLCVVTSYVMGEASSSSSETLQQISSNPTSTDTCCGLDIT